MSTLGAGASADPTSSSTDVYSLRDSMIEIIDDLPTLDEDDVIDRHGHGHTFTDEFGDLWAERYRPSRVGLPGFGESRKDCGASIPHICSDCGQTVEIGRTCAQSRCPRCAQKWVVERAVPIVSRIWSAAKMKDGAQYQHHAVVSPPPDLLVDADNPERACIDMIQDLCREIDFDGAILYHPWSGEDEDHDDRGEWAGRLFNGFDWEDVADDLQHRPHFHLVGTCSWFPGGEDTRQIEAETGWLIERITRNGSAISLGSIESLASATTYALSHVGIDCRGDRNHMVVGKVGSAYHNADDRHHRRAREAIGRVVEETLGISSTSIECKADQPADEHTDHDDLDDVDPADEQDADDGTDPDEPQMVECRGSLVDADDAEFVEDEGWQQTALFAEEAVETYEEWQEAGGWRGWQDRAQTTLDETDPPPAD